MKIKLKRRWDWVRKTFYVGTILEVTPGIANRLIDQGVAEKYTGEYPPKGKQKTNFFKPK